MKHRVRFVLLAITTSAFLPGCSGIRQRAEQAESRLAEAGATAQTAVEAAERNAGRILHLEARVAALEQEVDRFLQSAEASP